MALRRHLGCGLVRRGRLIVEPAYPLGDPALQGLVDGDAARFEVRRDRLLVPALDVQPDDRDATLCRVDDAMERCEAAVRARGGWLLRQHALDGGTAGAMGEARPADGADLVDVERRVLAFDVNDRLADVRRQRAVLVHLRWRHEAGHAEILEAGYVPVEGPLRCPGLGRALRRRMAEEHHRPDQFVGPLPGGLDAELQLAPLVGRLDPLAPCQHTIHRLHALARPNRSDAARDRPSGRTIIWGCQGHEQYGAC